MKVAAAVRLLRPKQWTKNLLVFAALIFARAYTDSGPVVRCLWAFLALCLVSSAVYVVNDALDAERDRNHPVKKNRPIASGAISASAGYALSAVCLVGGLALSWWLGKGFTAGIVTYLLLQGAYNAWFKHTPVLDVFALSLGFVLRAALGAAAISVYISGWLLFCTGALALLLGAAKRRHEFMLQGEDRGSSRAALARYNQTILDAMVVFSATLAALAYGIYAIESETARSYPALILTAPIVLYGILRYLFLVFGQDDGGEPENLVFGDTHMVVTVVLFVAVAFLAMSGMHLPYVADKPIP